MHTSKELDRFQTTAGAIQAFKDADERSPSWVWPALESIPDEPCEDDLEYRIEDICDPTKVSRKELVQKMDIEGYRTPTFAELVEWGCLYPKLSKNNWHTSLKEYSLGGLPRCLCLIWDYGERRLDAFWADNDWSEHCRFLFVRKSLALSTSSSLDTMTLDAIRLLKENGYKITKEY